jgi:hypothetical protein
MKIYLKGTNHICFMTWREATIGAGLGLTICIELGQQLHHPHKQMWQCGCPLTVLCSVKLQSPSLQSMVQTSLSISIHDLFDIKYVGRAFKKNGVLPLGVLMQFVSVTFCRQ